MRFITLLISCSLALVVSVHAAQDNKKQKSKQRAKPAQKQHAVPQQHHAVANPHNRTPHDQYDRNANNAKIHDANVTKQQHHVPSAVHSNKVRAVHSNQLPDAHANKLPAVQANKLPAVQNNRRSVQNIRAQHTNFHARPSTTINTVQFNQNYRIRGAESWHGTHYEVFRTYRPVWHDRVWWHTHYPTVVLIGGGWYFWNAGYWYPAWGYDTAAAYYPYDGPIYVGSAARPFDQVVADVQSILQEQGYYRGEVDGLVGPLTQDALAAYQRDQGLVQTAAIDQPTLNSLGLG